MSDPTPYTDDELAEVHTRARSSEWMPFITTSRRLLATVDAERARREQAEADVLLHHRCHVEAVKRWQDTCDAVLNAVIEHGTLRSVVEVVADWLDGSDGLNDEVCDLIRRALDASPTEGNPDE